jgi:hypothetical protein
MISEYSRHIYHLFNVRNGMVFDILVSVVCCLSFGLSWIESCLNLDSHHWGFMYAQALDVKRGLIPHKETLIAYGYLTSEIQNLFLYLFGEKLTSIGLATGIFYSASLFLSYKIFREFLPKYLSFFSVFLIFLLHGYIIYPWPNYFSYTFELLSLSFFISDKTSTKNVILAGFFLGLAFLCRYSAVPALLPPFCILLAYDFLISTESQKKAWRNMTLFIVGFLMPLLAFFGYLTSMEGLSDFFLQNKIIVMSFVTASNISMLINFLMNLVFFTTVLGQDSRALFFTLNFFWSLSTLLYVSYKLIYVNKRLTTREEGVLAVCLVTLFGYFNSIHIYEVFRLVNGASIGIGIITYTLIHIAHRRKTPITFLVLLPIVVTGCLWMQSLLFTKTSSVLVPWKVESFTGQGTTTTQIPLFQGKMLSKNYADFYDEIYRTLAQIAPHYSIINFTRDPVAAVLNDLPRVQFSSFYLPLLAQAYPQETARIQHIIHAKKAIILSTHELQIPGYRVILHQPWPADIPFIGNPDGVLLKEKLYISIPEEAYEKSS